MKKRTHRGIFLFLSKTRFRRLKKTDRITFDTIAHGPGRHLVLALRGILNKVVERIPRKRPVLARSRARLRARPKIDLKFYWSFLRVFTPRASLVLFAQIMNLDLQSMSKEILAKYPVDTNKTEQAALMHVLTRTCNKFHYWISSSFSKCYK